MGTIRRRAASIFVIAVALSSAAGAQERFENPAAGLALTPPSGWHAASLAQVQANRQKVRLSDPEWQAALETRSALPLVVFTKYAEPHIGLNPTVQITLRQSLRGTPTELLSGAIAQMGVAFPDFRITTPVHPATVAGRSGAHVRVSYTLKSKAGGSFPVLSRLWLVPRGPLMFLVGMSGTQDGADLCDAEFAAVLASLEIKQ
jgi:hypothetical protein